MAHKPQTYLGNRSHDWENVVPGTARLRVPGGWLYKITATIGAFYTTTFVPMPALLTDEFPI